MASSKAKGNYGEREVVKLCKEYWDSDDFMRSPESGALSTLLEGYAPADIVGRLAGDLLVPVDFPFCIESKFYQEIDLWSIIRNPKNNLIRQWWEQCCADAAKAQRYPLLTFKEQRKKRFVALNYCDMEEMGVTIENHSDEVGYLEARFDKDCVIILLWTDFVNLFPKENVRLDK